LVAQTEHRRSTMSDLAGVAVKTIILIVKTAQQVKENDCSVRAMAAYIKGMQAPLETIQNARSNDARLVESTRAALGDMNAVLQQTYEYCSQVVDMGMVMRILRAQFIAARVKELIAGIEQAYKTVVFHVDAHLLGGISESNERARQQQEVAERRHKEILNRLESALAQAQGQALVSKVEHLGSGEAAEMEALAAVGDVLGNTGLGISQLQQELSSAMGQHGSTAPEKKVYMCYKEYGTATLCHVPASYIVGYAMPCRFFS
jgi:hypothetical protein